MAAKKKTAKKKKGLKGYSLNVLLKRLAAARKEADKAEKEAAAKKKKRTELEVAVLDKLKEHKLDNASVRGVISVSKGEIDTVQEVNWPELYKYIQRTKGYDLLQRRVSISAVRERREAGKKVAGVKLGKLPRLNVSMK